MNDEIKEILAYFEEYVKITYMHDSEPMLNWKDLKIVLDYITNLQQELQRKDNNWNELKTYIQMNINATCNMNNDDYNEGRYNTSCDVLDKIKELEKM